MEEVRLLMTLQNFGATLNGNATIRAIGIPEPSAVVIVALAASGLVCRRRRSGIIAGTPIDGSCSSTSPLVAATASVRPERKKFCFGRSPLSTRVARALAAMMLVRVLVG